MATIHKSITISAPADQVWDALRDVGALHTRLVTGFVTDCRMDGDARIVTFANGMTARERIVDIDDTTRRVVWSAVGGRLSHHNASAQVFHAGEGLSRVVWIADLLPNELAPVIATMIEQGLEAMQRTLAGAEMGGDGDAAPAPDGAVGTRRAASRAEAVNCVFLREQRLDD